MTQKLLETQVRVLSLTDFEVFDLGQVEFAKGE